MSSSVQNGVNFGWIAILSHFSYQANCSRRSQCLDYGNQFFIIGETDGVGKNIRLVRFLGLLE